MYNRVLVLVIGLLNICRLDDVAALLLDIELDKAVASSGRIGDGIKLLLMETVNVSDVSQPRVEQTQILGSHGGLYTSATVVTADNNVLDTEMTDGIVDDTHGVEVGVADEVGNVAMDKCLAWLKTSDLLSGDARIGTSNPEVLRILASSKIGEETRVGLFLVGSPLAVVFKEAIMGLLEVLGDVLFSHSAPVGR